jgi:DNA-binding NtrC family response regulator
VPTARIDDATQTLPRRARSNRCGLYLRLPGQRPLALPRCAPTVIGSGRDCDIVIDDPYVSKRHARIDFDAGRHHVEDLDSTNGTLVDGVRVRWAWLSAGSALQLGYVKGDLTSLGQSKEPPASPSAEDGPATTLLLGGSLPMQALRDQLRRLAPLPHPVLLRGETGTGKELAARTLHALGPRSGRPFIAVNCGAIPEGLAESELFGHIKGAFTGAVRDRPGAFASADGGTLFLDEVGELPLALQAKLLRVLELRCITPVGGERERVIDVRIVSATHRDLKRMVEAGRMREDLYHRLGVLEVWLPPLRERPDDIPELMARFGTTLEADLQRPVTFEDEAVRAAMSHAWPGNVRALRNAVTRAAALSEGVVSAQALLSSTSGSAGPSSRATASATSTSIVLPRGDYASMNRALLDRVVAEEGSIRKAAKVLGIPRSTLSAWLREQGPRRGRGRTR